MRVFIPHSAPGFALTAATIAVFCAPDAAAARSGTEDFMPLGVAAEAPLGFLDLCRRDADACVIPGQDKTQIARDANRLYWAAVFRGGAASSRPASLLPSTAVPPLPAATPAAAIAPRPSGPVSFAAEIDGAPDSPWRTTELDVSPIVVAEAPPTSPAPLRAVVSTGQWKTIERINRGLNGSIRKASDQRLHGQADYWTAVSRPGQGGDCEDYVLTKRAALISAGVPEAALSIALVRTSWGEDHAVLLVAAADGERVLDNLTSRIVPWRRARYTWDQRQLAGRPMVWVRGPDAAPAKR